MKASPLLFGCAAVLIAACDDNKIPPGQMTNRDVPLVDVPAIDGSTDDVGDGSVGDTSMNDLGADAASDATSDTADASDAGDAGDASDVVDAPVMTRGLCLWNFNDLATFATRYALCGYRPPQESLNALFNPVEWEGGPLTLRACATLRCVADTSNPGTCTSWMGACLKFDVARLDGGTCASPSASCEGSPPTTYRNCVSGVETRDNCGSVGLRCVASGGSAACVPTMGSACAAGSPARCNGNVLEQCVLGVYTAVRNCDLTGGVCDATASTCRGAGAECTGDATSCDGTQLRVCRGGRWHLVDCGRLVSGASCQTVNTHSFCGIDHDCDPIAAAPGGACDGNTLVLCAAGRTYRYACEPRNGFTTCMNNVGCVR